MAKKALGSVTRTFGAVISGLVLGKAIDGGMSIETLEAVLNGLEYITAIIGIIVIQGWSLVDKHKAKTVEQQLKMETTHETKSYN